MSNENKISDCVIGVKVNGLAEAIENAETLSETLEEAKSLFNLNHLIEMNQEATSLIRTLKEANSLVDELDSKMKRTPYVEGDFNEKLKKLLAGKSAFEVVFGIIAAIEHMYDSKTIAKMINAYFN